MDSEQNLSFFELKTLEMLHTLSPARRSFASVKGDPYPGSEDCMDSAVQ